MSEAARPRDDGVATIRLSLIAVLALQMAIVGAFTIHALLRIQPWGTDFLPMWTVAGEVWRGHAAPYDFAQVSAAQDWLMGAAHKLRPFAYPPSALLLLAPFGLLGFWASLTLWCAATAAANAWASWTAIGQAPALALALVLPTSVFVLICGQVTLLIAALSVLGLTWLERRPWLAGALFGLALALKPSSLVLLPLALVAARAWRPLASAALTAAALAALSALLFGLGAWTDWLGALPRFETVVMADPSLVARMVAPTALARWLGLHGPALTALQAGLVLAAAAYVWVAFRTSRDWDARLTALLGGGLIAAPYAMQYETALLAAPAAMLLVRAGSGVQLAVAGFAYLLLALAILPPFGALAMLGFIAIAAARQMRGVEPAPPPVAVARA